MLMLMLMLILILYSRFSMLYALPWTGRGLFVIFDLWALPSLLERLLGYLGDFFSFLFFFKILGNARAQRARGSWGLGAICRRKEVEPQPLSFADWKKKPREFTLKGEYGAFVKEENVVRHIP